MIHPRLRLTFLSLLLFSTQIPQLFCHICQAAEIEVYSAMNASDSVQTDDNLEAEQQNITSDSTFDSGSDAGAGSGSMTIKEHDTQAPVIETQKPQVTQLKDKSSTSTFDFVPVAKRKEIIARLNYTRKILEKYGRAYDYRITTLKEFQSILKMLELENKKKFQNKR